MKNDSSENVIVSSVLIETLWNVNRNNTTLTQRTYNRINRNIVECKSIDVFDLLEEAFRINRNIVECKYFFDVFINVFNHVLIETLWNVNTHILHFSFLLEFVLIETLWNVNISAAQMMFFRLLY